MGVAPREIRRRVDEALRTVGMYEYRMHAPHLLSGGQKQRVAIAGVLAMEPQCIVLDEPTAMLDPRGRADVMRVLHRLHEEKHITIVLITHHMDEAVQAQRVAVLDGGHLILDGTPREIFVQTEKLHSLGLAAPQSVQLLERINADAGAYLPTDALTVEEIAARWEAGDKSFILPMTYPLGHLPLVVAEPAQYDRLLHGNEASLPAEGWTACPVCRVEDAAGRLLGIGQIRRTEEAAGFQLKLNKVFAEMGGANERTGKI